MKQREIWFANLDPTQGNEQAGLRPVLIISGNLMNQNTGLLIVCPLSTKIKSFPSTVLIPKTLQNGLTHDSEVLTFQIRVLSKLRLVRQVGKITETELKQIVLELNGIFEL
jgi:mRNA interferase MazF